LLCAVGFFTNIVYLEPNMRLIKMRTVLLALFTFSFIAQAGELMGVRIVDRRDSQTAYSYVVPGRAVSTSNTGVSCYGGDVSVNCAGTTTTSGVITPPRRISYDVTGATLSLQLPDGRIAVVNCVSKYKLKGDYINRRSCRIPLADEIQADFDGNNAKLYWTVSIDGKKVESETYKVLGILNKEPR
jgi:hypothetical protein